MGAPLWFGGFLGPDPLLVLVERARSLHRPQEGAAETPECLSQTHLRGPGPGVPHHWGHTGLGTTGMSLLSLLLVPYIGNTARGGKWWDAVWCPGGAAGAPSQNLQGVEEAKGRIRPPSAQVPSCNLSTEEGTGQGSPWAIWKPPSLEANAAPAPIAAVTGTRLGWGVCASVHVGVCTCVYVCLSVPVCVSVPVCAVPAGGDTPDTSELLGGQGRPRWGTPGRGTMPVPMGLRPRLGTEDLWLTE